MSPNYTNVASLLLDSHEERLSRVEDGVSDVKVSLSEAKVELSHVKEELKEGFDSIKTDLKDSNEEARASRATVLAMLERLEPKVQELERERRASKKRTGDLFKFLGAVGLAVATGLAARFSDSIWELLK